MIHRKKTFLMFVMALAVLGFFVGGILLSQEKSIIPEAAVVADTETYSAYLKDKFGYLRAGDGNGKLGADAFGMNGTEERHFSLQHELFGGGKLPAFSDADMSLLAGRVPDTPAVNVNDAFVMLRPNERLVLELFNFESRGTLSVSRNGSAFTPTENQVTAGSYSLLNMGIIENSVLTTYTNSRQNLIAYSNKSVRGVFTDEGYYHFSVVLGYQVGMNQLWRTIEFGFYLVKAENYELHTSTVTFNSPPLSYNGMLLMQNTLAQEPGADKNSYFYDYSTSFPEMRFDNTRFQIDVVFNDYRNVSRMGYVDSFTESGRITERKFNQLGSYTISVSIGFYDKNKTWKDKDGVEHTGMFVKADTWTLYKLSLCNFGFQAHYYDYEQGEDAWLGGKGVSSDITSSFSASEKNTIATNSNDPTSAMTYIRGRLNGSPAVTNMPPVQLRYNVPHLFGEEEWQDALKVRSRISYQALGSSTWTSREYKIGQPFEDAGTYAVLVYYTYPAARNYTKNPAGQDYMYFQVFYFRINNVVSDVRIIVEGDPKSYTYEEVLRNGVYASPFTVYSISASLNGAPLGPYERKPQYRLTYYNFGSDTPAPGYPKDISKTVNTDEPKLYDSDGRYVFSVHFGNTFAGTLPLSYQDFTVLIDRSPIDSSTYKATSTNPSSKYPVMETVNVGGQNVEREIPNVSVFGGGAVSLEWGAKASGVGMSAVLHTHYPIAWNKPVSAQATNAKEIKSGWLLSDVDNTIYRDPVKNVLTPSSVGWTPTKDGKGFRLSDPVNGSGLHVINIIDGAGNENIYLIIIDTASAGFAQFKAVPEDNVNVWNESVTVGVGAKKVVPFDNSFFISSIGTFGGPYMTPMEELIQTLNKRPAGSTDTSLMAKLVAGGLLVDLGSQKYGYSIQIKQAEVSMNNQTWTKLDNNAPLKNEIGDYTLLTATRNANEYYVSIAAPQNNSSIRRDFFFKVEDATGNVGWHYVQINPDRSQGMVFEDSSAAVPNTGAVPSSTAGIVQEAGVSNGKFLTFSLLQESAGNNYQITRVDIYFYPFTYEVGADGSKNNNYPFSNAYTNHSPYHNGDGGLGLSVGTRGRLYFPLLRGGGGETQRGLYAIKRTYSGSDDKERWYYVIADDNPIILPAGNDKFKTDVSIDFGGGKVARDKDFKRLNVIESNTVGNVYIPPNGKYSQNTFHVMGVSGPMTSKQFAALNLSLNVERLTESGYVSEGALTTLGDGRYRLNLTDGAGGFLWNITTLQGGFKAPNKSVIEVDIMRAGPLGTFWFNNSRVAASAYPHGDINKRLHSARLEVGEGALNRLTFEFHNDSEEFLAAITKMQWKRNNSDWTVVPIEQPPTADGRTRIVLDIVLADQSLGGTKPMASGDVFIVEIESHVGKSVYECIIDNTKPHYNLDRVRAADPFLNNSSYTADLVSAGVTLDNYPFAISTDFIFEYADSDFIKSYNSAASYNPFIDTARASWTKVDNTLADNSDPQPLEYYFAGQQGAKTFAEIVGLASDQNAFYKITEWDEVGGKEPTIYYVQVRGSSYKDSITFVKEVRADGEGVNVGLTLPTFDLFNKGNGSALYRNTYGIDMVLNNVQTFYNNNLFFEIKFGNGNYIRRLGDKVTFNIDGLPTVNNKASGSAFIVTEFSEMLQKMLNNIVGTYNTVTVNNRFELPNEFKFELYHISSGTPLPRVVADAPMVAVDVNVANMPAMFLGTQGLKFTFEVYNMVPQAGWASRPPRIEKNVLDIQLDSTDGENQYLVVMTDKFGRQLFYEHNGAYSSKVEFNYNSTAKIVLGDLYIGDEDGLTISYSPLVYDLTFYENGTLVNGIPSSARVTDEGTKQRHIHMRPGINDTTNWRIVAVRKGLNTMNPNYIATVFEFNFYSWLPDIELKNLSLEPLEGLLEGGKTTGVVVVQYSNSGRLFSSVINYTRTYEDPRRLGEIITDRVTISRSTSNFNLTQAGIYKIEIMNEVWARAVYTFEITDVSNTSYKVFLKSTGKELLASPVLFDDWSQKTPIPIYWVVGTMSDITLNLQNSTTPNTACKIDIRLSPNTPRELVGRDNVLNTYFEWVNSNTVVYRLRSATSPEHVFYFAVAVVSASTLDGISQTIVNTGSVGTEISIVDKPHYHIYSQISENGIIYGLRNSSNTYPTNVTYVEYWRNNVYCGRLVGSETLTIHAKDYGIYKFYVYDWAGNIKKFNAGEFNHFTIANLVAGPFVVNGETIVNGMVVNDKLELSVLEIPYDTMSREYAYINTMSVCLDKQENWYTFYAGTKADEKPSFTFTTPGFYQFEISFRIFIGGKPYDMSSKHSVYLLSSTVGRQAFSYGPYSNIEIVGVRHNGVDIRRNWPEKHLSLLELNGSRGGNGIYLITAEIAGDGIREANTREFVVVINNLPFIPGIIYASDSKLFGSSTTSGVQIFASPRIPEIYGETVFVIEREFEGERTEIERKSIGWYNVSELEEAIALLNTEGNKTEGIFEVRLESPNGGVFFSEAFQIGTPTSGLTILVVLIFIVGIVAAGLVFAYLRTRMRAK